MVTWSRVRHWLGATVLLAAVIYGGAVGLTASPALDNTAAAQDVRPPEGADLSVVITPQPSDSDSWRAIRRGDDLFVSAAGPNSGVAIQSEGEDWRSIRNGPLSVYGGWLMLATIVVLAVFFAFRGRIPIEAGPSADRVERFNGIERFAHWLAATTFVILALTGLNILYGRYILIPIIGQDAFSTLAEVGKLAHNYLAFGFMIGLIMMFVLWVKDNIADRYDFNWLIKGGGMFTKGVHPPARKFNMGQKIVFWAVTFGGIVISGTGIYLLFPFMLTDMFGMQIVQLLHAIVSLILIALIIAHIYIGTLGMVGAFDAMGTGYVDANWAKEHHSVWVAETEGAGASAVPAGGEAEPETA